MLITTSVNILNPWPFLFYFKRYFDILGFTLNWIFTQSNCVLSQTGVKVFGRAKRNYIIAKRAKTRRFALLIVRDPSLLVVLDRAWPVWSGYEMTCFCYITGTTIIYSVHELDFESPWLWDVNRGKSHFSLAIF